MEESQSYVVKGVDTGKGEKLQSFCHLLRVLSFSQDVAVSSNFLSESSCFDIQGILIHHT